jgi:hypothetical protein
MDLIIEKLPMNKGALIWFRMFGAIVWNLLNHFFIDLFDKPKLKTILEFGGGFGIVSTLMFNEFLS